MEIKTINGKRVRIVKAARSWIGTPYVHQASAKGAGCDCLGLVRGIWREIEGVEPEQAPPYTPGWGEHLGKELLMRACARHLLQKSPEAPLCEGDVVLFRWRTNLPAKHCAIVTGDNRIVHAYQNHAVQEDTIPDAWQRRIAFKFSFPSLTAIPPLRSGPARARCRASPIGSVGVSSRELNSGEEAKPERRARRDSAPAERLPAGHSRERKQREK